jgi:hypothetical protein
MVDDRGRRTRCRERLVAFAGGKTKNDQARGADAAFQCVGDGGEELVKFESIEVT